MSAVDASAQHWEVAVQKQLRQADSVFALDVSFCSAARRLVLFGPSGSGKTQTLRLMAGITRPDSGRVRLGGRLCHDSATGLDLPPQQRHIGYVFQDSALFPHLTVRQNIGFACQRGWRNPGRHRVFAEVDRWLDRLGLRAVAGHLPHQISGGQRQRTALARALVTQPSALLLDEPFAALDKPLRQRLREELLALQTELQLPLLLITHDDDDVQMLAQAVVHLEAGRVQQTVDLSGA